MNAWPKLVSEMSEPVTVEVYVCAEKQEPSPSNPTPDANLQSLLQDAWRAISKDIRADILRSAMRLRDAASDSIHSLDMGIRDEVHTILITADVLRDNATASIHHTEVVLRRSRDDRVRAQSVRNLKWVHWRSRHFNRLCQFYSAHVSSNHLALLTCAITSLSIDAAIEAEQYRLVLAERLARQAIEKCDQALHLGASQSSLARCVLAQIAYETGDIAQADALVRGQLSLAEQSGNIENAILAFEVSANVARAMGDHALAFLILQRGEQLACELSWPRLALQCAARQVTYRLYDGALDLACSTLERAACVAKTLLNDETRLSASWSWRVAKLQLELATKGPAYVVLIIPGWLERASQQSLPAIELRLRLMMVSALSQLGRSDEADEHLLTALQTGANAGLHRSFVDHLPLIGTHLRRLFGRVQSGDSSHVMVYLESLLAVQNQPSPGVQMTRLAPERNWGLTRKEIRVLHLIRLGLPNKGIAREMHIAPETVKSHVKRIFIKLSAKTRTEAVSRATELGFL